ncbi:LysR family transcriptional regulator [Ruegeria sp. R14_0]|nr:LysR family transcriptional regulator [Ruegeria sp. R14_0]
MTVADRGGVSAAADALNLSPSVISRSMSNLEKRLGVCLFYRTRGPFRLTPEGAALLDPATRMLSAAREALEVIEAGRTEPSGLLRVGVHSEFGYGWFHERIAAYRADNPKVSLELVHDDAVTDLVRDRLDIALRFRAPTDVRLYQKKLGKFEIIAVASPMMIDPNDADEPARLASLPYIGRMRGGHPDTLSGKHRVSGEMFEFTTRGMIAMDNTLATLHAVEAGLGIAFVLRECVRHEIENGMLVHLLPSYFFGSVDLYAVFGTSPPALAVRRLIEALMR